MEEHLEKASLRAELQKLYDQFQQMGFPHASQDERIRKLHDISALYEDDVSSVVKEVLKGPRRLFKLRHYLGLRRNKKADELIRKLLQTGPLEPSIENSAKEYQKRYAHMAKMVNVIVAFLSAKK